MTSRDPRRRTARARAAALFLTGALGAAQASALQEDLRNEAVPELPPPRTHYKGREIAPTMGHEAAPWLTRTSREREEHASRLIEVLGVEPGQTVCDLGCGNGFHSLPLAGRVGPEGRLLAVDVQPEMLALLTERAAAAGVENVEPILGTVVDPKLPEGGVDLVLLVDVYHELSHPERMLRAIREGLKPAGRLVLVEFRGEDPEVPIKPLHKMTKAQIRREVLPNGFREAGSFDGLPWQHVMFFERDDAPRIAPGAGDGGERG